MEALVKRVAVVSAVFVMGVGGIVSQLDLRSVTPARCLIAASPATRTIDGLWIAGSYSRLGPSQVTSHPFPTRKPAALCEPGEGTLRAELVSTDGRVLTSSPSGCILLTPTPVPAPTHATKSAPSGADRMCWPKSGATWCGTIASGSTCGTPDGPYTRHVSYEAAPIDAGLDFPDGANTLRLRLGEETVFQSNVLGQQLRYSLAQTRDSDFLPGFGSPGQRRWAIEAQVDAFERALDEGNDRRALEVLVEDVCGPVSGWIAADRQEEWATALLAVERRLRSRILPTATPPAVRPPRHGFWDDLVGRLKPAA